MFNRILSAIFVVTAIAVFFLLIRPLYADIQSLKEKKSSFDESLSTSREVQKKKEQLLSRYNVITQEDLEKLSRVIPSNLDSMKFVLEMDNIAGRNGMIMKNINVNETKDSTSDSGNPDQVETVPFTMSVVGTYAQFHTFLKDMERDLRLIDVKNISLSIGENDFYEFRIAGVFYWKSAVVK